MQSHLVSLLLSLYCRMQAVFLFQSPQYGHGAVVFVRIADFPTLLIDAQRYDMEVLPLDVLMLEDDIRLVAVTHTFHIFPGDIPELFIGRPVFRRRVQRSMEDRIGRPAVGFEVRPKTIHTSVNIKASVFVERFEHLLPEEHFGFVLIHFLLVIAQSTAGRGTRSYIRNHSAARLARFRISTLRAFNSLVRCSNAAI